MRYFCLRYRWIITTLGVLVATASAIAISAELGDMPNDAPEFYFTRLIYRQNPIPHGYFRPFTMANPGPYHCPEFGGKRLFPTTRLGLGNGFSGCRLQINGSHSPADGAASSECELHRDHGSALIRLSVRLHCQPGQMVFSRQEAAQLREYLLRGGFLHLDDFWGLDQKENLVTELRKVFPEYPLLPIPLNHPILHTFFDIDEIIQTPNQGNGCRGGRTWEHPDDTEPRIYGISDDKGRLMVAVTYNTDLGDAWEYMDLKCYPESIPVTRFALD